LLVIPLDFGAVWSGSGDIPNAPVTPMNIAAIHEAIQICLSEICSKLDEAARIARAAEACAVAGSVAQGIEVAMDIEQLIFDAGRLHDAVSLLHRLTRA
jgi:hypothetical protein